MTSTMQVPSSTSSAARRVTFTHGEALQLYEQLQQHTSPRTNAAGVGGGEGEPLILPPEHIPLAIPTRFKYALEFDDELVDNEHETSRSEAVKNWARRAWARMQGEYRRPKADHESLELPAIIQPGQNAGVSMSMQHITPSQLAEGEQIPPRKHIIPKVTQRDVLMFVPNWLLARANIITWLPYYNWRQCLRGDVIAGLTIGAMLVPQGLSYATVAGLPPVYGLYAAFVPQFMYALCGTSRHLAVGPVSILSLLTATALSGVPQYLANGTTENPVYIESALATAFVMGIFQIGISVFRLGFLVNLLSHPVISAFTSGSAIIIGTGQLNNVIGYNFTAVTSMYVTLYNFFASLGHSNPCSLVISSICFVFLFGIRWFPRLKLVPTALLLVIISTLVTWRTRLDVHYGVAIVKTVPPGLPHGLTPTLHLAAYPASTLISNALIMALVGYLESSAVARIYAIHNKYVLDTNQELFGLGLGNLVGSFFGAYPNTGSFSRTAVNSVAGGKTLVSSLVSGFTIMIVLLVLTPSFYFLPKPVLGCIVVAAVTNLFDMKEPRFLWRVNKLDFFVYVVTFVVVLQWGVDIGLGIAAAVSLAMVILRSIIPTHAVLGRIPGTHVFRNILRFPDSETQPGTLILRFDKNLYFANVGRFVDVVREMFSGKDGKGLDSVVLDFSCVTDIDATAIHVLSEYFKEVIESDRRIFIGNAKGPCRDTLREAGLADIIGVHSVFLNIEDAVHAAEVLHRERQESAPPLEPQPAPPAPQPPFYQQHVEAGTGITYNAAPVAVADIINVQQQPQQHPQQDWSSSA